MPEAISDTGPILHMREIGYLRALGIFVRLIVPGLIAEELRFYSVDLDNLGVPDLSVSVVPVDHARRNRVLTEEGGEGLIHPADAEVFILAQDEGFQTPVLTDDLALRRRLEAREAVVTGSVGILVRAYKTGRLTRTELETAVDTLFTDSSLYLNRAFLAYVRQLLVDLR